MWDLLLVLAIVAAAGWYAVHRFMTAKDGDACGCGCSGGCAGCGSAGTRDGAGCCGSDHDAG